jgi:glycosyltransferase involved in cell wall biosynthesis
MRILYVRNLFRPADFGGNRYPWEVTPRLAARGHDVTVVTTRSKNGDTPPGVRVREYPSSMRTPVHTFLSHAVGSRRAVGAALAAAPADVVIYSSYDTAYAHFIRPEHSAPSVYIYHSRLQSDAVDRLGGWPPLHAAASWFVAHVERTIYSRADALVAVSPFSLSEIEARLGRPRAGVHVIPTGVDASAFVPGDRLAARRSLGLPADARILVAVGRLAPVKRYDLAIRALSVLAADPRWLLLIMGHGPDRARLEAVARETAVGDRVRFLGHLTGGDQLRALHAADIQVCTSEFENWSLALLEGLSAGLSILGVPRGGIGQLLEQVDRRLVLADDRPETLAARARELIDDAASRATLAARARALVVERYSWDATVQRLEDVLAGVARPATTGRPRRG